MPITVPSAFAMGNVNALPSHPTCKRLRLSVETPNDWDSQGQLLSRGSWVDMKVAGIAEMPDNKGLHMHFADSYEPTGPFGAKGIGEVANVPTAAVIAHAIQQAVGFCPTSLPITKGKILEGLASKKEMQSTSGSDCRYS